MSQDTKRLLDLARQNDVLDDAEVRRLVLAAGVSDSKRLQEVASRAVLGKSVQRWEYPFEHRTSGGDIELGKTYQGQLFQLSEEDLTKHLLAVGQSGSGKTTLFYSLLDGVGEPFWVFDLKRDYRHLLRRRGGLLVLPWSELRFNPLRPPEGVSPRRWAQVFSEIFGHATALLSGSKNYLMKRVIQLYQLYELFEDVSPPFPSLHELELLVEVEKVNFVRKSSDYRDTLLNRLEAMNLVAGTVFDCSQGYGVEELLQRDVVFEFDGLSRDVQNFLMEVLFAYVFEYRLAQGHRGSGLRHLFVLDEGKRVFSVYKERQDASGIPEIDELTAKMREFGEGLVVGDQEASKLTDSIKANTYTKFLLPTGDRKQFEAVAESMDLSERQAEFASELGTGEAVVQVGNGGPVPVKLDNYQIQKDVSDADLQELMEEKWRRLEYEERSFTKQFELKVAPNRSTDLDTDEVVDDPEEEEDSLSSEAERLLMSVVERPFAPLTERYEDRFSSRYKGNKAKSELAEKRFVTERQVRDPEGQRKLLQPTQKGRQYAEEELDLDTKERGRGGVVHSYWQNRIKTVFDEAGWNTSLEHQDADVYTSMGNTELAVEVAMGDNPREVEHVQKHLDNGIDVVWVACRNQDTLEGLRERLEEQELLGSSVVLRPVRHFNNVDNPPV